MQPPPPQPTTIPMAPAYPPASMTTEQIQKCLDENKKLILAILENQNLGKLAECAQYQTQLQRNLMYLAAIADAQPQGQAMPPQMALHPAAPQGVYFMQQSQQPVIFPQKVPPPLHHPQAVQGQFGKRPIGASNGMHPMHQSDQPVPNHGPSGGLNLGGSKQQDAGENSAVGQVSGEEGILGQGKD